MMEIGEVCRCAVDETATAVRFSATNETGGLVIRDGLVVIRQAHAASL